MVNRGRSGGCVTCKGRRVKCDEEKPHCRRCRRHGLSCGGYKTKLKLRFREQNHKFGPVDVGCRALARAVPPSLPAPDTAVAFYLRHYAGYGRSIDSARGFFEVLVPVYRSQENDSALSHAVSALASLVWSIWRHGSHGATDCRPPRQSYAQAVAGLRRAIADRNQVNMPATLLAVLALQLYENVAAIYGLRLAARTHHDGAISLLSLAEPGRANAMVGAYVQKFVLHIEVSSAMRRKRPIQSTVSLCLRSKAPTAAPYNPSVALDDIGASIADLQAAHAGGDPKAEAKRIDDQLLAWARSVPLHWRPIRLTSGHGFDSSIPSYMGSCDIYPSCQIANIWNLWRLQRLVLVKLTLGLHDNASRSLGGMPGEIEHVALGEVAQELIDSVCRSVPFYLGNRCVPSNMADFTDATIFLPSCPSAAQNNNADDVHRHLDMPSDEHRRHIIAQGPWHIMSPLSRLLTLFSEDARTASLLRPATCQWVRAQFLRVLTLLHISPMAYDIDSDATADFLARQVRKGAMFMSGP
ncbi:hypothetical protein EJ04DRAFT_110567 [Polyplosphaeria fusca]|uniref:Zn(2)-C6 fungal-type domain-containing protein n=1 Tax=Polyplosphaeria fusca TaxID=682080 RepID=A0A9P4UTR6_9PLEO|nr:hypothetical protein EJ04DRAFT_110567 [Polyplosphaeria fusca]